MIFNCYLCDCFVTQMLNGKILIESNSSSGMINSPVLFRWRVRSGFEGGFSIISFTIKQLFI